MRFSRGRLILIAVAIVFGASLLILLLFPSMRRGPIGVGLPSDMSVLTGEHVNFSILYPANWSAAELANGNRGDSEVFAVIINPGWWMPSVWFARHDFQSDDLDQVAEWGEIRARKEHSGYESRPIESITTAQFDGLLRPYTWTSESPLLGKVKILCEDLYVTKEGVGYAISFCAEEEDWNTVEHVFDEMMGSLRLN